MIGERLKLARSSAGMTLRELGEAIGNAVTFQAISKYEANEAMPGSGVLRALANALSVTERYLLNPRQIELTGIEARSPSGDGAKKELRSIEARVLSAIEKYIDVEELVPGAELVWSPPPGFPFAVKQDEDVEEAAEKLRAAWGLGTQAIADVSEVLEEHGVKVVVLPLGPKTPAMLFDVKRGNYPEIKVIAMDADAPGERQRLAVAQELGRLVLEIGASNADADRLCERFARAFLMLRDAFVVAVGKVRKLVPTAELFRLKSLFGVAVVQIIQRCADLQIVKSDERKRLMELAASSGWNKAPFKEPQRVPRQEPSRFERLCLRAFTEEIVSESRVAELLGVPVMELAMRMDSAPGVAM